MWTAEKALSGVTVASSPCAFRTGLKDSIGLEGGLLITPLLLSPLDPIKKPHR